MPVGRKDEVTDSVVQLPRVASQEEPGGGNEVEAEENRTNDFDLFDELGYDEFDSHYNDIIPPGFDDYDEEEAGSGNTQQSVGGGVGSGSSAAAKRQEENITSTTTTVRNGCVAGDLASIGTKRARSAEPTDTTSYASFTFGSFDEMWGRTHPSEGDLTSNHHSLPSSSSSSSFLDEFKRCFPKAKIDLATPTIANIVSIMHLGIKVNLQELLNKLKNVEFNTGRKGNHSSITLRLEDPVRCVAMIRPTGTVLLLGATNMSDTRMAAEIVARVVRISISNHYGGDRKAVAVCQGESGISPPPPPPIQAVKYRVRCIMARFDLQHPIRLDELAHSNPSNVTYEPSKTAGCQIKLKGCLSSVPKAEIMKGGTTIKDGSVGGRLGGTPFGVFCTVYQSGKVVMSGAQSVREVEEAFQMLIPLVAPFAKQ